MWGETFCERNPYSEDQYHQWGYKNELCKNRYWWNSFNIMDICLEVGLLFVGIDMPNTTEYEQRQLQLVKSGQWSPAEYVQIGKALIETTR